VAALGHPRGYRRPEADGAGRVLRLGRRQYLQDIVPVEMDIGVDALGAIVATGVDNEAVVGVDISRLVRGVIARP